MAFRDRIISIGNQKLTKELNKAASRQSQALKGLISSIEQVESFALKIIFLIDEKFEKPQTS